MLGLENNMEMKFWHFLADMIVTDHPAHLLPSNRITIFIVTIIIIIDIQYSTLFTYNVQKGFIKDSQWTDVYGPYIDLASRVSERLLDTQTPKNHP